jgi:hypothetical protein
VTSDPVDAVDGTIDISDRANVGCSLKTCSNLGQGHIVRLLSCTIIEGDVSRKSPSASANQGNVLNVKLSCQSRNKGETFSHRQ